VVAGLSDEAVGMPCTLVEQLAEVWTHELRKGSPGALHNVPHSLRCMSHHYASCLFLDCRLISLSGIILSGILV
jgi:hypothetical protein